MNTEMPGFINIYSPDLILYL